MPPVKSVAMRMRTSSTTNDDTFEICGSRWCDEPPKKSSHGNATDPTGSGLLDMFHPRREGVCKDNNGEQRWSHYHSLRVFTSQEQWKDPLQETLSCGKNQSPIAMAPVMGMPRDTIHPIIHVPSSFQPNGIRHPTNPRHNTGVVEGWSFSICSIWFEP